MIFIYNLFGYYIVFQLVQFQVRDEVKTRLKYSVPESDLVLISIDDGSDSLLIWVKPEKEFRYQGQMYDIVKLKKTKFKTLYYCLQDFKESKLFEHLDRHINNYIAHNPDQQNKTKNLLNTMAKVFFIPKDMLWIMKESFFTINDTYYIQNYQSISLDIGHPPPKVASFS